MCALYGCRGHPGFPMFSGCVCRFMRPCTSSSLSLILTLLQHIQTHCTASPSFFLPMVIPPQHRSHISALCMIPKHFCPIVSGTTVLLLSPYCRSIVTLSNFDSQEKFLGLCWQNRSLCWQHCTGSTLDYEFKLGTFLAVRSGGLFNLL